MLRNFLSCLLAPSPPFQLPPGDSPRAPAGPWPPHTIRLPPGPTSLAIFQNHLSAAHKATQLWSHHRFRFLCAHAHPSPWDFLSPSSMGDTNLPGIKGEASINSLSCHSGLAPSALISPAQQALGCGPPRPLLLSLPQGLRVHP